MSDGWIVVRNWTKFQHYGDRRPVWIKMYTKLLDDPAWRGLTMHRRGLLVSIWLLYATSSCEVPASASYVAHAIGGLTEWEYRQLREAGESLMSDGREAGEFVVRARDLKALEQAGFISFSASKPLEQIKRKSYKDLARAHEAKPATRKPVVATPQHANTTAADPVQAITKMIRNGVIHDRVDLEAEIAGYHLNGNLADQLRELLP